MVVWGIISGATAASQTYGGLLACRFILGFVEAAYFVRLSISSLTSQILTLTGNSLDASTTSQHGIRGKN
jgi:hypothetical protein